MCVVMEPAHHYLMLQTSGVVWRACSYHASVHGKMIFVVLQCLSRNAQEYIMPLTLVGVRHLISPRWLEKM